MDRRRLLKGITLDIGAAVAGVVGVPAILTALSPVLDRRRARWRPVGPLDGFPVGAVTKAVVEAPRDDWAQGLRLKGVFVYRPSASEIVVYSRNCTDLSCPLTYDEGSAWFYCPCHGGIFSTDGVPRAGPPSRPMYRYATRTTGGVLEIDLNSVPPMA